MGLRAMAMDSINQVLATMVPDRRSAEQVCQSLATIYEFKKRSRLWFIAGLLFIELAVARCAWWNFASCSRRRSATLYFLWFALFTWIGWFSRNAPFRLHEVWDEHAEHAQAVRLAAIYSTWALSVAIIPALKCFGYSGHDPQHNDATTGDALLR